ncbi:unnamed protein product [Cladocopium goreaui]|uniref:Uncharacterized protein n=1 Tax=Cladocopium goreaui TaxID=2562237 RepID=A0A9P1BRU7_9DINO|nr:unnamed protein product [Cladocopium goreaui]
MRYRQGLLHQHGHAGMFYVLSSDSSPQGKLDLMMTLEDRISRTDAEELIACQGDVAKLEEWSSKSKIMTTQLPLGIIGSGNSGLGAKHECIFHQVKLDCGSKPAELAAYCGSVVGYVADFGTESQFTEIPAINIQQLFMNAIENSNGVLAARPDIADGGDATQMESQAALCYMEPDAAVVSADQRIIDLDADDAVSEPTAPIVVAAGPKERDVGTVPDSWSLGGALNVNGLKHIFSNISGDILKRWEEFSHFQEALSAINTLHYQTFYRDRLQKLMRPPMDKLYRYYEGGSLIMWRWSSLVDVAEALHRREGALRSCWNLQAFLNIGRNNSGTTRGQQKDGARDDNSSSTKLFNVADRAVRSPFFWAYLRMVILLHGLVNDLGSWAEGIARKAIALFDDKSNIDAMATYGRRHPLTARFLKKDFAGPDALRPLLEQFVQGADLSTDESLGPLRAWIGALRLIRVVERETEVLGMDPKDIKHSTLLHLIYQRTIQFARGAAADQAIPHSEMRLLRDNKNQLAAQDRNRATSLERSQALTQGVAPTPGAASSAAVAGHPENCFQLCRPSDTDNIQLIRFLGAASREDPTRDSAVMQKLLVWDHVGSVPTDVRTLTFALETDFAVSIVEDMVAARAFVGSGRSFEFYGSEGEMRNMVELENKGYVQRAADSDGTASESRWYLTRKVRPQIGNPKPLFFPRHGVALENKTTLELMRELIFQGFDLIENPMEILKNKKQPYTNQRGCG